MIELLFGDSWISQGLLKDGKESSYKIVFFLCKNLPSHWYIQPRVTYEFLAQHLHFLRSQDKSPSFLQSMQRNVRFGPGREVLERIFKYAKTTLKSFVAMPNNRLPTNFQLNVFIFEACVSLQPLLQSMKKKTESQPR